MSAILPRFIDGEVSVSSGDIVVINYRKVNSEPKSYYVRVVEANHEHIKGELVDDDHVVVPNGFRSFRTDRVLWAVVKLTNTFRFTKDHDPTTPVKNAAFEVPSAAEMRNRANRVSDELRRIVDLIEENADAGQHSVVFDSVSEPNRKMLVSRGYSVELEPNSDFVKVSW